MSTARVSPRPWLADLLLVVGLAALATLPFLTPTLDLALQRLFYAPDAPNPWGGENAPLWRGLYRYGPWPALFTALGALSVLIAGRWRRALARWRVPALYLLLSLALGPGLLVNVAFKDHWGRPRPRQVTELGGTWPYQTFVEKGIGGRGKSFPCGHSSMGYFFIAFYFLWRRRYPLRAAACLAASLVFGTLIGAARMAAGGHFASDVAWSAVMAAAAAWLVYHVMLRVPEAEARLEAGIPPAPLPRWVLALLPLVALFAITMGILGTPAYSEFKGTLPAVSPIVLSLDVEQCDVELILTEDPGTAVVLSGDARGFGWPGSLVTCQSRFEMQGRQPAASISVKPSGWFNELNGRLVVTIPARAVKSLTGHITGGDLIVKAAGPEWLPAGMDLLLDGTLEAPPAIEAHLKMSRAPEGHHVRTPSRP